MLNSPPLEVAADAHCAGCGAPPFVIAFTTRGYERLDVNRYAFPLRKNHNAVSSTFKWAGTKPGMAWLCGACAALRGGIKLKLHAAAGAL